MMLQLTILVLLGLAQCSKVSDPVACSRLGKYRGSILKNSYDEPIFAFRGIRYAEPPIGELRFQPPVPINKHEEVHDASKDPPACPQPRIGDEPISEDCLFVNVYTTKLPSDNENPKRPVLVIIHSSDFARLSSRSNIVGPDYLMNHEIVLVTFNYRIGALGFLSTGDKEAPGNLGLKDQVAALKWVKENIEAFGGDPDSVTIHGNGSGGSCVNLHLVSPLSKGLFHRAVMASGSVSGAYAFGRSLLKLSKKQAKIVGCPTEPSTALVECLKTISAEKLGESLLKLNPGPNGNVIWKPVIERDFGQEIFLPDHPVKLVLQGKFQKVPMEIGYMSDEFSDRAIKLVQDKEKLQKLNDNWNKEATKLFLCDHNKTRSHAISKDLRSFYFGDSNIDNSTLGPLIEIFNDGLVGYEINRAAKLISEKSEEPVFYYYYSYKGKYSFFNPKEGPSPKGPVLYDDLIYLTPITTLFPKIDKDDPEFDTMEKATKSLVHFAKTGVPARALKDTKTKWEPYNSRSQKYLVINAESELKEKLHSKRFAEWEKHFPLNKFHIVQDYSSC
ncbi:esterase FE4-like [Harmonia axyridis]|uniref:esterase FE4-like n=1 Tax=Harmonia axyridis TaxID=115357 RepID=UPI001E2796B5|nr:esterase FE4-like [Harmonia axyridis]